MNLNLNAEGSPTESSQLTWFADPRVPPSRQGLDDIFVPRFKAASEASLTLREVRALPSQLRRHSSSMDARTKCIGPDILHIHLRPGLDTDAQGWAPTQQDKFSMELRST